MGQHPSAAMMEMPVLHYDSCPINFGCLAPNDDDSDAQSGDDQAPDDQVQVPIWLLEQEQKQKLKEEEVGSTSEDHHDTEEESMEGEEEADGFVADLPMKDPVTQFGPTASDPGPPGKKR